MGVIKETTEEVSIALDIAKGVRAWASLSFARTLLVMSVIGAVLLGCQYGYVNYLLDEARKASEIRRKEIVSLGKEHGYKASLDAVTACLESEKEEAASKAWYCKQAVEKYRNASTSWPQDRVKEVIEKNAYLAMRNDISHYLRTVDLDRLIDMPHSREEDALKLWLSKTVFMLWTFIVVAATMGPYLLFRVFPNAGGGTSKVHRRLRRKRRN